MGYIGHGLRSNHTTRISNHNQRRGKPPKRSGLDALSRLCFAVLVLFLAAAFLGMRSALAQETAGVLLSARAGFDGYCKQDSWLPVHTTLENQGPGIDGRLEVAVFSAARQRTVYSRPVSLPGGARQTISLHIYPEGRFEEAVVRLASGNRTLAQAVLEPNCVPANETLVGVLAARPAAFFALAEFSPSGDYSFIAQLNLDDLPVSAPALGALDLLVFSSIDTGLLTPAQTAALETWVAAGGQMLVTGGPDWQKTLAGLQSLSPLAADSTQTLNDLGALNQYIGSPQPIQGPAAAAEGTLTKNAQVLVSQSGVPLLVSKPFGYGKVFFLAVDPSLGPLREWENRVAFYQKILSAPVNRSSWSYGIQNWDYAAEAVSSLPNLGLPKAGLVISFLAFYVLAIGPVNYLVLGSLKRRELAWFTIPGLVILFSALAVFIGGRARGSQPVLNKLAVVQTWPGVDQAQVSGLVGVFSPVRGAYHLRASPGFLAHPIPDNATLGQRGGWSYTEAQDGALVSDLRLDAAEMSALALQGQIPAPEFQHSLQIRLEDDRAVLEGKLANLSAFTLKNSLLITPVGTYAVGELKPQQTRQVSLVLDPQSQQAASPISAAIGDLGLAVDPLVNELAGAQDARRDPEIYRRFNLINALYTYEPLQQRRSNGLFLAGWSDKPVLEAELTGTGFEAHETVLHLIALQPNLPQQDGRLVLTPEVFYSGSLDPGSKAFASPYNLFLETGSYSFRFTPIQPVSYRSVNSLTLHLDSYSASGPVAFQAYLWDFARGKWSLLQDVEWGDFEITHPANYIDPAGEIRLRLENSGESSTPTIKAAGFTLIVEQ